MVKKPINYKLLSTAGTFRTDDLNILTLLFPAVYCNAGEIFASYGFQCPIGWYGLLYRLSESIQSEIISNNNYTNFSVEQVKEKFGILAFYYEYGDNIEWLRPKINEFISIAVKESGNTCRICGKDVKIRGMNWRFVCDDH